MLGELIRRRHEGEVRRGVMRVVRQGAREGGEPVFERLLERLFKGGVDQGGVEEGARRRGRTIGADEVARADFVGLVFKEGNGNIICFGGALRGVQAGGDEVVA